MIHKESQKDGLKVKNLRVSSIRTEAFKIEEEAIERVDDFLYLESKIDENEGTLLDIQQRINKARGTFSRLKNVWRGSKHQLTPQN